MHERNPNLSPAREAELNEEHVRIMNKIQAGHEESGDQAALDAIVAELHGTPVPQPRGEESLDAILAEEEAHGVR